MKYYHFIKIYMNVCKELNNLCYFEYQINLPYETKIFTYWCLRIVLRST